MKIRLWIKGDCNATIKEEANHLIYIGQQKKSTKRVKIADSSSRCMCFLLTY